MTQRMRQRIHNQEGFGLILVIGMSTVILGIVILTGTIAERSLTSSAQHVSYGQALSAAESGVDQTIARLQHAYVTYGTDFPVPSTSSVADPSPSCQSNPNSYVVPSGGFASQAAERTWATGKLTALLSVSGCLQHASDGDYVVLKPSNRQTVYAMGFSPRYGAARMQSRLIKSEYLFLPYKPSNAILTGQQLLIDSSTMVTTAPGYDSSLASVHANGGISVQNGNPIVYGQVSSSVNSSSQSSNKFYGNPGGTVVTTPPQPIPAVSALAVYAKWSQKYASSWYNLCSDGKVKAPTVEGPCVTTAGSNLIADLGAGGADQGTTFRGFRYSPASGSTPAQWLVGKNVPDGVYYAVGSNVAPDSGAGNTVTANATILAQAADETACQKVGGSIDWDHNNIGTPMIPNLFMLADADLTTESNFSAGSAGPPVISGLFIAGDQVHMSTSSNGAYGAVVAADQCPASPGETNEIKNPSVYFNPDDEAPFTDVINTTLWLEY
ncbi:MAG: hypothetical protein QOD70_981 [Frankiales bacterium]|jgi:hypothetical protein|nr:hypothetical protein [Frankiales bacterium]